MKQLESAYREAPKFESPADLDERILAMSRARVPLADSARAPRSVRPRWISAGYAVACLCSFGIGFAVLLETGMIPFGDQQVEVAGYGDSETASAASSVQARAHEKLPDTRLTSASDGLVRPEASTASGASENLWLPNGGVRATESVETNLLADTEETSPLTDTVVAASDEMSSEVDSDALGDNAASVESFAATTSSTSASVANTDDSSALQRNSKRAMSRQEVATTESLSVPLPDASPDVLAERVVEVEESVAEQSELQRIVRPDTVDWLLMQDPEHITVQLATGQSSSKLSALANALAVPTQLLEMTSGSGEWWLLYGSFNTRAKAKSSVAALLEELAAAPEVAALAQPTFVTFGEIILLLE